MDNSGNASKTIRWMKAIIIALRELGGEGSIHEVLSVIARNENLSQNELEETRGVNKRNKFQNEVSFARIPLVKGGYIDNGTRNLWRLTEAGRNVEMTDELAGKSLDKVAKNLAVERIDWQTIAG